MKAGIWLALALISGVWSKAAETGQTLLNVSYDVAREFYEEYNPLFIKSWQAEGNPVVKINQSHGGSSKQARSVIDGLEADVVTMNQPTDLDAIAEKGRGLVVSDWRARFPHNASPYSSTMVFLVRNRNPKRIRDWDDLVKPGVAVVVPNPKTAGNGRYSYLAAWSFALAKSGGNQAHAKEFVARLFKNVPVLDTGGRGATTTFVQRGIGDVLLTFEAETITTARETKGAFEIVIPSSSVEAEMPVAVVERVVDRRKTRKLAEAYLNYLYSEPAQELIARHGYRPWNTAVLDRFAGQFKPLKIVRVEDVFGSWSTVVKDHFADGGSFDQIMTK